MSNQDLQSLPIEVLDYFPAFAFAVSMQDGKVLYANHQARLVFGNDMVGKLKSDFILKPVETIPCVPRGVQFEKEIKNKRYQVTDFETPWVNGETVRMLVGTEIPKMNVPGGASDLEPQRDAMTGIYNYYTGMDLLEQFVQEVKYMGLVCTVCYIDLNDLQMVNDNYSHEKGDDYIMAFVNSVKSSIRRSDVFVRMGGDEFMLIFPSCKGEVSEHIMSVVSNKLELADTNRTVLYSFSYGIVEIVSNPDIQSASVFEAVENKMRSMKSDYHKGKAHLNS